MSREIIDNKQGQYVGNPDHLGVARYGIKLRNNKENAVGKEFNCFA